MAYATFFSDVYAGSKTDIWFMEEVEKRSGNAIKFERYWANSLMKATDLLPVNLTSSGLWTFDDRGTEIRRERIATGQSLAAIDATLERARRLLADADRYRMTDDNLLVETPASGTPQVGPANIDGRGAIQQGALEQSNVNVVEELVSMIATQRAYEMNSKVITAADQMLAATTQVR